MNPFVTKLSKHCYYGNITNILNYYGEMVSEAELVLLSDTLNCDLCFDKSLFLGIQNQPCERGLEQIGYRINELDSNYLDYVSLLDNGDPILLLINSSVLTHDNIFKGTDKDHHIVLLKDNEETMEISDSFVPTIPKSLFVGDMEKIIIQREIQAHKAFGTYLQKQQEKAINQDHVKRLFLEYIKMNVCCDPNSIICKMKSFCNIALNNSDILFTKESLNLLSYDVKVAGAVARFDYLAELSKICFDALVDAKIIAALKSKWDLIASKIMKCSMTLKKEYYVKIFEIEIPELVNHELCFYKEYMQII